MKKVLLTVKFEAEVADDVTKDNIDAATIVDIISDADNVRDYKVRLKKINFTREQFKAMDLWVNGPMSDNEPDFRHKLWDVVLPRT